MCATNAMGRRSCPPSGLAYRASTLPNSSRHGSRPLSRSVLSTLSATPRSWNGAAGRAPSRASISSALSSSRREVTPPRRSSAAPALELNSRRP